MRNGRREYGILGVYSRDVFFVLGFAALVTETGVFGKDGSARTALLHISSLRRVTDFSKRTRFCQTNSPQIGFVFSTRR